MLEVGVAPDMGAVFTLFLVSLLSLIGGVIFQKWPEKVQAATEAVDGFAWFVTPEVHRAMIVQSGVLLRVMSFAALLGAAWVLSQ
jgi:hypothetical protein